MEDISKQLNIAKLIAKSLQGELSSFEQNELDTWLATPANQRLYRSLRTKDLRARKRQSAAIDTEKNWRAIERQITFNRRPYIRRWAKYAAAIALPLLFAATLLLWQQPEPQDDNRLAVNIEPVPGSSKAVLILSGGKQVDLSKEQNLYLPNDSSVLMNNRNNTLTVGPSTLAGTSQENEQILSIPIGGEYKLVLPDGTRVWLNSDTRLRFPSSFKGEKRTVHLEGEAYFEVAPDKQHPFIVNTQALDIEVLGTKFNVKAYHADPNIYTTLAEGSVRTTSAQTATSLTLTPDQQCRYTKATGSMDKKEVDTQTYIGWTKGKFIFENETLEEIMKQLGRWYDTQTIYQSEDIKNYRFTGHVDRFDNISTILRMIEKTYNINFNIKENVIIISK